MTTSAHELPKPHEPEDGTLEPEVDSVEELLEKKSDYSADETNVKGESDEADKYDAAHASKSVEETPVPQAPVDTPVESVTAVNPDEKAAADQAEAEKRDDQA